MKRKKPSLSWVFPVRDDYVPIEGDIVAEEGNEREGAPLPHLMPSRDTWFLLRPEKRARKYLSQNATLPEYRWRKLFEDSVSSASKAKRQLEKGEAEKISTEDTEDVIEEKTRETVQESEKGLSEPTKRVASKEEAEKLSSYDKFYEEIASEDLPIGLELYKKIETKNEMEKETKNSAYRDFLSSNKKAIDTALDELDKLIEKAKKENVSKEELETFLKSKSVLEEGLKMVKSKQEEIPVNFYSPYQHVMKKIDALKKEQKNEEQMAKEIRNWKEQERKYAGQYLILSSLFPLSAMAADIEKELNERTKEVLREKVVIPIQRKIDHYFSILRAIDPSGEMEKMAKEKLSNIKTGEEILEPKTVVEIIPKGNKAKSGRSYTIEYYDKEKKGYRLRNRITNKLVKGTYPRERLNVLQK